MYNWSWEVENKEFLEKTIKRCRENQIILPKFSQLKHPYTIPSSIKEPQKRF